MPVIGKKTYEDLWALGKGNYTNFARYWLGSTLGFVKSQAFEYQCTHEVGKEGAAKLSAGIGLGTIHHPFLEIAENPWYTSVPTTLPLTKVESEEVNGYTEISTSGKFGTEKASENLYVDIIVGGLTGTAEEMAQTVATDWHGEDALLLMNDAWLRLADYYATLQ